ncbi:nucleotide sugar dehydrogenase [Solwaraspora sp. WMMD406]|uniref:nucleotide sugar dehydrogenase n=1 Tax=Solwaraspora sp. WMMD406 TaxID=3016095 RepID=UPI0024161B64|nr:nucleotide sugar dehydrogenase [Solwaraspora sp. WMMD406]MDG4766915.1 nucleotide sugar dehydrogenase [Solwaraspora sp. WMMD406]
MNADVTVCGLGYVGLVLALEASASGLKVTGYDIDQSVVDALGAGRSHIDDVLDDDLIAMTTAGFTATCDVAALGRADVVTICVPTPLDPAGEPDLGPVRGAATAVAAQLRPGMLVVLESTSYPGTTDEVVRPILEQGSGLTAGIDFHLAFSPERIDPGNKVLTMAKTPKVVGGYTPGCTTRAVEFYSRFVDEVVHAKSTREAEMAKLLENTYRQVNIALINEMAILCHRFGIDVWDVIDCASTKPFGFQPFRPGPGVGGHCIPVDPHYLAYKARRIGLRSRLIEAAEQVNTVMPRYVVSRSAAMLAGHGRRLAGARVLLLGVTYKADISDLRMSPAYEVVRELRTQGAELSYHDPYAGGWSVDDVPVTCAGDLEPALRAADLSILLQEHAVYQPEILSTNARLLFDARGVMTRSTDEHVEVL